MVLFVNDDAEILFVYLDATICFDRKDGEDLPGEFTSPGARTSFIKEPTIIRASMSIIVLLYREQIVNYTPVSNIRATSSIDISLWQ